MNESRLVAVATICWFIGTAMFGVFVIYLGGIGPALRLLSTGRSAELSRVFQVTPKYLYFGISLLAPATVMLVAVGLARRRGLLIAAGFAALVPYLTFAYPTGNRTILLPFVGGVLLYFYLARGKRPSFPTVAVMLILALFVSSYLLHVRREKDVGSTSAEGGSVTQLVAHPKLLLDPVTKGADASEFPALAGALIVIPSQLHYGYGKALLTDILTRPVPRVLWHGKPRPPREAVVKALFPAQYSGGGGVVNPEFSAVLLFFWDFGFVGAAAGMLLYGLLARFLYEYYLRNHATLEARLILAVGVPLIVEALRDSPVDAFSHYVVFLGPVLLAFYRPRFTRSGLRLPHLAQPLQSDSGAGA